jgi:nucleoside-diphosphate-sugar epimerase
MDVLLSVFATGTSGTIGSLLPKSIQPFDCQLLDDSNSLDPLSEDCIGMIHLAAIVGENMVLRDVDRARKVNVAGTIKIAKHFLNSNGGKFVFVSTSHVYDKSEGILTEKHKTAPLGVYAHQKLEAELALEEIFRDSPERLVIARVFSIFDWNSPKGSLGHSLKQIVTWQRGMIRFSEDQRSFLTAKQVAFVLNELVRSPTASGLVNVCSNAGYSVRSAAQSMCKTLDYELLPDQFDYSTSSHPKIVGDNTKLSLLLPQVDFNFRPKAF